MNDIAVQAKRPTFSAMISSSGYQKLINNTLKDPKRAQRFIAAITSAVAINPALQECDPRTILSGALVGESLGLSPSPQLGQYYLVPFKSKAKYDRNGDLIKPETVDAQFQIGYKGYVQLALRSGYYKHLNVLSVKEGELKRFDPLSEEIYIELIEDEAEREKAPTVGYVAMFEYLNGFRKVLYWSRDKMERHALQYSKGYAAKKGYTFWERDFDAMAYKTMLRQLISKWGVMSIDLQTAFEQDWETEPDSEQYIDAPELPPQPDVIISEAPEPAPESAPETETGAVKLDEV